MGSLVGDDNNDYGDVSGDNNKTQNMSNQAASIVTRYNLYNASCSNDNMIDIFQVFPKYKQTIVTFILLFTLLIISGYLRLRLTLRALLLLLLLGISP